MLFKEAQGLAKNGLMLREGRIVDATIISAPSSTKNESGQHDPDMYQTQKGNQWYFGIKMHIGVDDTLGPNDSIDTTAANVHEIVPVNKLLHDDKLRVFGDAGYPGHPETGWDKHRNDVSWFIAKRPDTREMLDANKLNAEKIKARIRAKVEQPFRYFKQVFGYRKMRYQGLLKNTAQLFTLFGLANLELARRVKRSQCA